VSLLFVHAAHAARETPHDAVEVRAYLNDTCVIADEPFFVPAAAGEDAERPKFLPLIGLVVGKLTELFINHEIEESPNASRPAALARIPAMPCAGR